MKTFVLPVKASPGAYKTDVLDANGAVVLETKPFMTAIGCDRAEYAARAINAHEDMLIALRACMAYIPGSEVRSWPPGFQLKHEALQLGRAAILKAEGK